VAYVPERETSGTGRQWVVAGAFAITAIASLYLAEDTQQRIAQTFQGSVLRPFIWTQETLTQTRMRADQIAILQEEVDALTAIVSTQGALADENRSLRDLLGLVERAGPEFLRATVIRLRPGAAGSESTFLVDVGSNDGVEIYAAIVSAHGLVGRIRDVYPSYSVGMDWTSPDFRVGAMLEDGSAFGMVENLRGEYREEDRLVLNGTAYHENLARGARVITSGLGGTYPRGIPIGVVDELIKTYE
jgi:rod shape-determining protein MreC